MSLSNAISQFSETLEQTAVSQWLQATSWVIPTVQTVHILSVATVIGSSLFVSLRLLEISGRDLSHAQAAARFLPLIWWTLPVLLVSGSLLIIAEPGRSLQNPAFYLKMGFLLAASALTLVYQLPLHKRTDYWQGSALRVAATKLIAVASLTFWAGVILSGRWIAYVGNL